MPHKNLVVFQELLNRVGTGLRPPATFQFKSMFGGMCGYFGDHVFASLSDVGLALKLAPSDQSEILALPGAQRLRYDPQSPPSKQYIVLPPSMLQNETALTQWVERSLEHVRHMPRPRTKKKKEPGPHDLAG